MLKPPIWTVAATLSLLPAVSAAQVRASERGGVFQVVNGTTISVEYGRPKLQGRSTIFGGEVPWGEVWTPGANWATTLDVDKDVTVNGHPLPKGKYSVWMQVEPGEWTVIFDRRARMFHLAHPGPDSTQIRFPVTPVSAPSPELLTWTFSKVSASGATLQMAWAGKLVQLDIAVPMPPIPEVPPGLAAEYVGKYRVSFGPDGPPGAMQVRYEGGKLLADWTNPPEAVWTHLVFIKMADDWFYPGAMVDNQLYDVVTDLVFEFAVTNGGAKGFAVRALNDQVIGTGTLTP